MHLSPPPFFPINVPVNQPVIPPNTIQNMPFIRASCYLSNTTRRGDMPLSEPQVSLLRPLERRSGAKSSSRPQRTPLLEYLQPPWTGFSRSQDISRGCK